MVDLGEGLWGRLLGSNLGAWKRRDCWFGKKV